jgi:hypothetical protein
MLNIAIPKTHYNGIANLLLEERADGACVAIAIGDIHNVIPFCINTTTLVYQLCGHPIHDVTRVRTSDGTVLTTPADYAINADKNEITLTAPHDPSGLVVDIEGAETADSPHSLILNGADALLYLVETVLDKDPLLLDPAYLADLKTDRIQEVKVWLDKDDMTFGNVVGKLESSLLFKMVPLLDGTYGTVVYEGGIPANTPSFTDEDYLSFSLRYDWTAVKHKIAVKYDEDVSAQMGFKVEEASSDLARLFYGSEDTLEVETYLVTNTSTINRDGAVTHGGTYAGRFDVDDTDNTVALLQEIILTPGAEYTLSFWHRTPVGRTLAWGIRDGTLGAGGNVFLTPAATWQVPYLWNLRPGTGGWVQYTLVFNAHAAYANYVIQFGNALNVSSMASSSVYVDDLSILATIGAVEMLTDGGLENWDDATHLTDWYEHHPNSASLLAADYLGMYETPPIIAEFEVHGWGLDLIPGRDKVILTRARAGYAGGVLNGELFRINRLVKKPGTSTVVITAQLDSQTY